MPYFFLSILAWFRASWQSTRPVSNDGAVEAEEAGLESGRLGSPQLEHETASEPAAAEAPDAAAPPDQGAVPPDAAGSRCCAAGCSCLATLSLRPPITTANQASLVAEWQPSVAGRDRESTKLKEHLRLSFLEITITTAVLINLFYIRRAKPISENPSLIVASAFAFLSLLSGFGLMFDTMRQLMSRGNYLPRSWSKHLLCLSIVCLAFTLVALIASSLPKAYYYMPVVLVPTLPVVAISFYHVHPRDGVGAGGGGAGSDDPHKADRKRSFQLAVNITTFSFMGALATLIGYHNNSSNRADHVYVKVAISFMSGASLTGLVTLLLNRMLTSWNDWKKTAAANAIMLGLLVPAVLMVATTFLGGVVVAAATTFPATIAATTWYVMEYHGDDNDYGQQQEDELLKPLYPVALTAMSVSFGAVMAIFAGFLGGGVESKGEKNLEVCVFFVLSCFVSSVNLGLVTFRTPKKVSLGDAAKALGCLTLASLVLAALALVSYVGW